MCIRDSPCTAKKAEYREDRCKMPDGSPIVDSVLTFEELDVYKRQRDDCGEVGCGTHERFVVAKDRFMEKANRKKEQA